MSGQRGSSEVLRIEEQRGESCLLNIGKGSILALTPVDGSFEILGSLSPGQATSSPRPLTRSLYPPCTTMWRTTLHGVLHVQEESFSYHEPPLFPAPQRRSIHSWSFIPAGTILKMVPGLLGEDKSGSLLHTRHWKKLQRGQSAYMSKVKP